MVMMQLILRNNRSIRYINLFNNHAQCNSKFWYWSNALGIVKKSNNWLPSIRPANLPPFFTSRHYGTNVRRMSLCANRNSDIEPIDDVKSQQDLDESVFYMASMVCQLIFEDRFPSLTLCLLGFK